MVGVQLYGLLRLPNGSALSGYLAFLAAVGTSPTAYWVGILPLIAVIIASDSMAWDRREGLARFYLVRTTRKNYILGKTLAIFSGTALVFTVGLFITFVICMGLFPAHMPAWHFIGNVPTITAESVPNQVYPYPMWFHKLFFRAPVIYIGFVWLLIILSALTWVSIAILISQWTHNLYIVLAGPWLVFIGLSLGFIAVGAFQFSPVNLSGQLISGFSGNGLWPFIYWSVALVAVLGILAGYYAREGVDYLD